MTATTKTPPVFYTGWCGLRLPPESHRRCARSYSGRDCSCECHLQPEVLDLDDALRQMCRHLCSPKHDRHDPICTTVRHHLDQRTTT